MATSSATVPPINHPACDESARSVPSVAMMKVIALPLPSSSAGRTETGMPAVSDASGRLSRSARKRRSAPPQKNH